LSFKNLNLIEPILHALEIEGYTNPTPIQQQAIPVVLKGRDLLACAQTGTGKTAAFSLPMLQILHEQALQEQVQRPGKIKALILTPTRELALQISENIEAYGRFTGLKQVVIFGGVPQRPQTEALRRGVDILIATPGRLLDLVNQRYVNLQHVQFLVLDEADRMLDMGFVQDVKRILARLPEQKQTVFFSATMPPEIQRLSKSILIDPVKVEVTPVSSTAELIDQAVYYVEKKDKRSLLVHLLQDETINSVLVFTRTKFGADKVAKDLTRSGIHAEAIHGDKSQGQRQRALENFKLKRSRVLVATDIAARGIDVDNLGHVINYELPNIPETYVHRIGRTGRAGAAGKAISFCDTEEKAYLRDIHRIIAKQIPVVTEHPYHSSPVVLNQHQETLRSVNSRRPFSSARRGSKQWAQAR
jgi:ATP-dependent RNA helicase RhlE